MKRLIELTKKHKIIMDTKDIVIIVYPNASGFLWALSKLSSGTDLGWSGFKGNCAGAFETYEDCLEDAITLIDKCDLMQFKKDVSGTKHHWRNYAEHLNKNYR